ncbi:hypothetical protein K492DRAFT_161059 [Lichtheimia hyalospora FSU 10163]|nr:hypothetical protein K492DRAFT_161059 [Lichtheimia hyalospora FSU 10163]
MERIRSNTARLKIHVENDHLIMHGSPNESAGCVLRGVLDVHVKEPIKVKSIHLRFSGRMVITWTEPIGNGHERLFHDDRTLINHTWEFLPKTDKLHTLEAGTFTYEFELPLPGDLPETTHVASFYLVQYRLKGTLERARFLPNNTVRRTIHVSRQLLPLTPEFLEAVSINNRWTNKLDYEISVPTKMHSLGDKIPVSIKVTPLTDQLRIRHLSCTFKEYMICRASSGWFGGHSRAQGRVVYFVRDDQFGRDNSNQDDESNIVWNKTLIVPVPSTNSQVQCDVQNDAVRIRHKLKFVISIENPDGHVSELRAALPIQICALHSTGLPSYEETWRTLPYDPTMMVTLLHLRAAAADAEQQDADQLLELPTGFQQQRRNNQQRRRSWRDRASWIFLGNNSGTSGDEHQDDSDDPLTAVAATTSGICSTDLPSYSPTDPASLSRYRHSCFIPDTVSRPSMPRLPTYDELLCASR